MLTLTDVLKLKSEMEDGIIETSQQITALKAHKCVTMEEYKKHMAELRRQTKMRTRYMENKSFFLQVEAYINGGMTQSSLEEQRNAILVKLRTIDERLKYDAKTGQLRIVDGKPLEYDRATKNPEEKKIIAAHDAKYGVKKLKRQLKALNYILKG